MKFVCFATLLASFVVAGESAVWKSGDGVWTDSTKWSGPVIRADVSVSINGTGHVSFDDGDVAASRIDVGDRKDANPLLTINGGSLAAVDFVRLGELPGSHARMVLNGGTVCTTELAIGGMNKRAEAEPPCVASLDIRGGSLVTKYLMLGWQPGSRASLRIVGSKPERIVASNQFDCALTNAPAGSTCELSFDLDALGVTPIEMPNKQGGLRLSRPDSTSKTLLHIGLLDDPPVDDVTLIRSRKACMGAFDQLPEGSVLRAEHAGRIYEWRLSYHGGASKCDVVLNAPHRVNGDSRTPWTGGQQARVVESDAAIIKAAWEKLYRHVDAIASAPKSGLLAFPGAEGFGAHAVGGRGGRVLFVTNLNDSGEGSLREAVSAKGPRTVIFRVGGVIELKKPLQIREPFITIAGQTAPGDGICLKGSQDTLTLNGTHDVIIRGLRVRTGHTGDRDENEGDCITCYNAQDFIIDHCSTSWGTDETLSCTDKCDRYTVQWCVMAEGLDYQGHSMGTILGGDRSTWHHNLWAHCRTRNPRFAGLCRCDFRNNVIYDWGDAAGYGDFREVNYVNNHLKPGPSLKQRLPRFITGDSYVLQGSLFARGNVMEGHPEMSENNQIGIGFNAESFCDHPHEFPSVATQSAAAALDSVLANAGATTPKRDVVDERLIKELREGGGHVIRLESEVGGCPSYAAAVAPKDSDNDGIPDEWEKAHGLNLNDATDANQVCAGGYTHLEIYLNSLIPTPPTA